MLLIIKINNIQQIVDVRGYQYKTYTVFIRFKHLFHEYIQNTITYEFIQTKIFHEYINIICVIRNINYFEILVIYDT